MSVCVGKEATMDGAGFDAADAAEEHARQALLSYDDAESGARGRPGTAASAALLDPLADPTGAGGGWGDGSVEFGGFETFAAPDDEEAALLRRLRREREMEMLMRAEEFEELQRVYTKKVKRSCRVMRRLPEPGLARMGRLASVAEETEEGLDTLEGIATPVAVGGAPGEWHADPTDGDGGGPRLQYHSYVYLGDGPIDPDDGADDEGNTVATAGPSMTASELVGVSPSHYERAAAAVAARRAKAPTPPQVVPRAPHSPCDGADGPPASRFVRRMRRRQLRDGGEEGDEEE